MIILKHNSQKHFSSIFLIVEDHPLPIGVLAIEGIELLMEEKALIPITEVEIIEKYFTSVTLIKDINKCEYYELSTQKN